jgi:hypothetical protein
MGNLTVQVKNEKGNGLKDAKVTVDWGRNTKSQRTDSGGWVHFWDVPLKKKCTITVNAEGYTKKTFELTMKQRESREQVQLTPVEQKEKFLKVTVADDEGKKVEGATVRISRGNKTLTEDKKTDGFGTCNLKMPTGSKGQLYVIAEKKGYNQDKKEMYIEQPQTLISMTLKRKDAVLMLKVSNEANEPLSNVEVRVGDKKRYTSSNGEIAVEVPYGKHKISINKAGYAPYESMLMLDVGGDTKHEIKLTTKYGALNVKVVDKESQEPVAGIEVYVSGLSQETNENGVASFDKIPVGVPQIEITDLMGIYRSEQQTVEIKEKQKNESEIEVSSSFDMPDLGSVDRSYSYLKDQRGRVAAYDTYLPEYYEKIGENLVELLRDSGKSRELLRVVRGIPGINKPPEFVDALIMIISNACKEIGNGMRERRNLEIFEDIKRFVVDKGSATADVKVSLEDVKREDLKTYMEKGKAGTEEFLREIDQALTKTTWNTYPMSVLFKIAKQIANSSTGSGTDSDERARALVASIILGYVKVMLTEDANVKGRLQGLIT